GALLAGEAVELEDAAREALDAPVLVEREIARVRFPVDVLLHEEAGRGVVDAVVHAAPEDREMRALDERDLVLAVEFSGLEPVVVESKMDRVPVHDVFVRLDVRRPRDVRGLEIARELDRPVFLRCAGGPRSEAREQGKRGDCGAESSHRRISPLRQEDRAARGSTVPAPGTAPPGRAVPPKTR